MYSWISLDLFILLLCWSQRTVPCSIRNLETSVTNRLPGSRSAPRYFHFLDRKVQQTRMGKWRHTALTAASDELSTRSRAATLAVTQTLLRVRPAAAVSVAPACSWAPGHHRRLREPGQSAWQDQLRALENKEQNKTLKPFLRLIFSLSLSFFFFLRPHHLIGLVTTAY